MSRMSQAEVQTLKAVLLYIIQNSRGDKRDVYGIVKTAYYAQLEHFVNYATPMFDDKIYALPFGPVPSRIYNILKVARGDSASGAYLNDERLVAIASSIQFEDEFFYTAENPDMAYLSKSDIDCLNRAIAKVAGMTFSQIKWDTHGQEWQRAFGTDAKILDNLSIAKEAGADKAHLDYLNESLEIDKLLG